MSVYYPSGCDADIAAHNCGSCSVELARVRSVAFINKSYYATLIVDPENAALWAAGFAAGDIFIYPETQGEFDGGAPNIGQGYGDTEETLNSYTFNLKAKDPNYVGNRNHWNSIKGSRNFHVAFRSETVLRISDVPVTVVPTNPIANDLKAEVVWDFSAKWTSGDFPTEYTTPEGVFECVANN
jgi:hypothetical protein